MAIVFKMPALSPTMIQGDILRWIKKTGAEIQSGDTLLEIETDKAVMDFEATDSGELFHIFFPDQSKSVQVGTPVALFKEEDDTLEALQHLVERIQKELGGHTVPSSHNAACDEISSGQVAEVSLEPSSKVSTPNVSTKSETLGKSSESSDSDRVRVSPLAKKIAALYDVDLTQCSASGVNGRIVKSDVERVLAQKTKTISDAALLPLSQGRGVFVEEGENVPFSGMRSTIARRLTQAKQEIPHFYMRVACRMDTLMALRAEINRSHSEVRISVNDFILKATALALKAFPAMNVNVSAQGIQHFSKVGISVAVSLESGLITPIVQDAAEKSLLSIAQEVKTLVERARSGKLMPHEYQGGTFTISNLGMFQIEEFCAIINPPQAGILAVSATLEQPIVEGNAIVIGKIMNIVLSADHRAVDGVLAAQFLRKVQHYLEHPLSMLIN
jgi:pyruvate dehydrogenase E2 component (dihydrolipoamide acetyltransferase)